MKNKIFYVEWAQGKSIDYQLKKPKRYHNVMVFVGFTFKVSVSSFGFDWKCDFLLICLKIEILKIILKNKN